MNLDRRKFLKAAGILLFGGVEAFAEMFPEESPLIGKKWAMIVDLSKCKANEGCKDCMVACHTVHNVPSLENKNHEIKWIWQAPYKYVFPTQENEYVNDEKKQFPTIVLCNHCENPPCVRVCPTQATFKRKDGIVMMDQHRCIGCRYCMAACPYGARSFNWKDPRPHITKLNPDYPTRTNGVVEKCTFCAERLAKGKIPACVEACPHGALIFGDVENPDSEIRKILRTKNAIQRKPGLGTSPQVYYIMPVEIKDAFGKV
ncbi:4Fe-4S dicluster domain-containing protein [bacterium]|nr:4Fe-4S dicluster domain-containing protein [bacterium]